MRQWIIEKIIRPLWIVNEYGEMGVRILGVNCYYYKWETPLIYGMKEDSKNPPKWREVFKREFGECVISRHKEVMTPREFLDTFED